jgi:hypothetical protein
VDLCMKIAIITDVVFVLYLFHKNLELFMVYFNINLAYKSLIITITGIFSFSSFYLMNAYSSTILCTSLYSYYSF